MNSLHSELEQHFGFSSFRPGQEEIVRSLLDGHSTLAILPTGGGKSLTYQLPGLLLGGITIVISPLLSLIRDQIQSLREKAIPVEHFDSTLDEEQRDAVIDRLEKAQTTFLYTSPESLANPRLAKVLKAQRISLAVIDEAHCLSEWGHSFRPEYLKVPRRVKSLKPERVSILTATATPKVASDLRKQFRVLKKHEYRASSFRPNLQYHAVPTSANARDAQLLKELENARPPAVVYVMRQEDAERVTHLVSSSTDHTARAYHAGMTTEARHLVQDAFLHDQIDIVVATIAFGMGVDKPNIRSVIHYHLPKTPEGWLQESGRAGRDNQPAQCTLLACADDVIPLTNFLRAKQVSTQTLQNLLRQFFGGSDEVALSQYHLRVQHDMHASTLSLILAYLEIKGFISQKRTSWRYIKAYVLSGHQHHEELFPKSHRATLKDLLQSDARFDTWQAPIAKDRLWKSIELMVKSGDYYLRRSGWHHHYQIKKQPDALDSLTAELNAYLTEHSDSAES